MQQNGNSLSANSLLGNLADGARQADSPSNLSDGLDEENDELMYDDDGTLDNEDGGSLSGSSNGYTFSEALSPSSQTEANAQNSIANILGASGNTASLMNNVNNVLNSVLNGSRQTKSERTAEPEGNNLPSSPESATSANEEETNEK